MSQGLEIWNADGSVLLTISDQLARIIGNVTISSGGSITAAGLAAGRPFYVFQPTDVTGELPTVTFSGTTMNWSSSSTMTPGILFYGVY